MSKRGGHRHGAKYGVSDLSKKTAQIPKALPGEYLERAWQQYLLDKYGVDCVDDLTPSQRYEVDPSFE